MLLYVSGIVVSFLIFVYMFKKWFEYCVDNKRTFLGLDSSNIKNAPHASLLATILSVVLALLWPIVFLGLLGFYVFEHVFKRKLKQPRTISMPLKVYIDGEDGDYITIEPEVFDDMVSDDRTYASLIDVYVDKIKKVHPELSRDQIADTIIEQIERVR